MTEVEIRIKFKVLADRFEVKADSKEMLKELNDLFTQWLKDNCDDKKLYKELMTEKKKMYSKLYRVINADSIKEYQKEYQKEYRKDNADRLKEYQKQYYNDNVEKAKEKQYRYNRKNKNRISEYQKQYHKQYDKQYYKDNEDRLKEYSKHYRNETKVGRSKMLANGYRKMDQKKGFDHSKTVSGSWIRKMIFGGQKCFYCGEKDWHKLGCDRIDNSKGHTPDNIVCSCGKCNNKRGTKQFEAFCKKNNKPDINDFYQALSEFFDEA